jgi:hypothetical protein
MMVDTPFNHLPEPGHQLIRNTPKSTSNLTVVKHEDEDEDDCG